jgi:cell filamentation protein
MYDAVADPYCYPGTTVLINKLDLRDQARLDAFVHPF